MENAFVKSIKDKYTWLLLLLLLVGFALRVYQLSHESIWFDEGASIYFAKKSVPEIFFLKESNPPLYYIVLHWWINVFGDSEFSVRFPSVIFALLSLVMMYAVGKRLFGKDIGLIGALMLGVSRFHIYLSQEARAYSLSGLLTLVSMYFFLGLLKERRRMHLAGYIFSSCLLMYSHIYGFFIIAAQNICYGTLTFFSKPDCTLSRKKWILLQGILLCLFAPWAKTFIGQVATVAHSDTAVARPAIGAIPDALSAFSGYPSKMVFVLLLLAFLSVAAYEKVSGTIDWKNVFRSLEGYQWKMRLQGAGEMYFLVVWLLTPIVLPVVISRLTTPIYLQRYELVAAPAFFLMVSKGIGAIGQKHVRSVVLLILVALSLYSLPSYYSGVRKDQWRDAARYIDANALSDDLVVVNPGESLALLFNYYSKRADFRKQGFPEMKPDFPNSWSGTVNEGNVGELKTLAHSYKRLWLLLSPNPDKGKPLLTKMLAESFRLLSREKYLGVDIYLYEREGGK